MKRFLAILVTLTILTTLTLSLTMASAVDIGDKQVTIEALIWLPDIPTIPVDMAKAFGEKYPNLTVDVQLMTDSEVASLQPRMAANNMPDFHTLTAGSFANEVADGGYVLDVGDTQAWANTLESLQQQWISPINKVKYGISGGLCTTLIYYNKGMFDQAGITDADLPEDYPGFVDLCAKLKDAGITPLMYTGLDPNTLSNSQYSYGCVNYITKGDNDVMQGIATGTYTIPLEDLVKTYERVIELPNLGYCNDGYMSTDYIGSLTQFVNGDAAMVFNGTWVAGSIFTDELSFEVGCFLPPWNDPGVELVPCLSTETGHAVGKTGDAEREAVAKMFLEFWYGDGFSIYQNPRQCVPGQKMETIVTDVILAPQIVDVMAEAASYSAAQPLHFGFMPSVLNGSMVYFQEMLAGMAPEQAAQAALNDIANN